MKKEEKSSERTRTEIKGHTVPDSASFDIAYHIFTADLTTGWGFGMIWALPAIAAWTYSSKLHQSVVLARCRT